MGGGDHATAAILRTHRQGFEYPACLQSAQADFVAARPSRRGFNRQAPLWADMAMEEEQSVTKVLGHQQARARLARAVASQQVSHAYLFTGPESIGKTTLALDFAKLLLCEHPDLAAGAPCGICASCRKVEHGNHPDVTLVAPEEGKRQLGVDIVRESVMRLANLAPSAGPWRVFVLPDVERMTLSTVNALLKTLEEPPPSVVLLLTSAEPENLLPTLLSRCQVIPLQPLAPHEVAAALEEGWHASP